MNVVPPDGIPRRYAAYSGESLLEVLTRNGTPGIYADDQGGDPEHTFKPHQIPYDYYSMGVSSGQDQVHVSDPFFEATLKLNKIHSSEEHVLAKASATTSENSRLASCVQIRPELNEMIVVVGDNRPCDGDWFSGKDGSAFWKLLTLKGNQNETKLTI